MDWKKILLIVLFVVAAASFAFFLYFFFWRTLFLTPTPETNVSQSANGQLPATVNINGRTYLLNANGRLEPETNANETYAPEGESAAPNETAQGGLTKTTMLANDPAFNSVLGPDGDLLYYNPNTGKFQRVSADGEVTAYNNKVFNNVSQVTWSNNRNQAVLEYPDGSNIVFDFAQNKQVTLPKHWQDFSFAPADNQLVFKSIALDVENRFLAVAKPDGSQSKILENIGGAEDQFQADWSPNNQMVATFSKGKDLNRSEIYFVGLNNENFKYMLVEGRGFEGQWSPEGDRMVYSVYNSSNGYKPELWIADADPSNIGNNRRQLNLQTWSGKCSFASNQKIFCAVPASLPEGVSLDRSQASGYADRIYEIDLATGSQKLLAIPEGNHSIDQIMATDGSNRLFFHDQNTNRLYKINL